MAALPPASPAPAMTIALRIETPDSSERETEHLGAGFQELDLKAPVVYRSGLADQLIHPLLHQSAVPFRVDIGSVGRGGDLTVEENAKPHGRAVLCRAHHEVDVARV